LCSLILILILGQLDHFEFAPISSPQTVGDSFHITIYAYDATSQIVTDYNAHPWIYSSLGLTYCNQQVSFTNGVCMTNVMVTLASNMALVCNDYGEGVVDTSNYFDVMANAPAKLLSIVPNETHAPGTETGKIGVVIGQVAGVPFMTDIYITDNWFNRVDTADHAVNYTPTDPFIPQSQIQVSNGMITYPAVFRTAGSHQFYLDDITNSSIKSDTSSSINIYAGTYSDLLVILPGETHLPGDTTSITVNTPGKSGVPDDQYISEDFVATVFATDSMWNKTSISGNVITLRSNFPPLDNNPLTQSLSNGEAQFIINFSVVGDNQNLWAEEGVIQSYINYLNIVARTVGMEIMVEPDTISAGDTALITTILYDINSKPIEGKYITFEVISGNGYLFNEDNQTDSTGTAQAYFSSSYHNELNTIGITADDSTFLATCFVFVPDPAIMEGRVIAYPNPMGIDNQKMQFIYFLPTSCNLVFAIYDPFGNLVHKEDKSSGDIGTRGGVNTLEWNGRNDKNKKVASGLYYVVIKGFTHTETVFEDRIKVGVIW
jgi:hypothetical protein